MELSHGKKGQHGRTRFSITTESEAKESKLSPTRGPITIVAKNHAVSQLKVAVVREDYGPATQPASPIEPEPDYNLRYSTTFSDWSPLDDGIECRLPHASTDKPSREEVDAHIVKMQTGSTNRRRLPVFVEICP